MYFPIILIPEKLTKEIRQINAETLDLPPEPIPPHRPVGRPPQFKINKVETFLKSFAVTLIGLLIGYFCFKITRQPLSWLLMLPFCYFSIIIFISSIEQTLQIYKKQKHNYNKEMQFYQYLLDKYEQAWLAWLSLQKRHNGSERRKKIQAFLSEIVTPPTGISKAPQGYSEADFKEHLEKHFPQQIIQGVEMPVPNQNYRYSADFVYCDENMRIDIEIDEPYYYNTNQPTHACNQIGDKKRNEFFLDNGWIVIRFAEEQAVKYPTSCCKEIAKLIARINGNWENFNSFKDVPNVPLIKHWNTAEAKNMAQIKYRETYLPAKNENSHKHLSARARPNRA